jgi:hypothetical protein
MAVMSCELFERRRGHRNGKCGPNGHVRPSICLRSARVLRNKSKSALWEKPALAHAKENASRRRMLGQLAESVWPDW